MDAPTPAVGTSSGVVARRASGGFRRGTIVSYHRDHAGLGNRIRALLGARSLALHTGRRLVYVWPRGPQFEPRLTDLWEFDARGIPQHLSQAMSARWPYRDHTLEWLRDETAWKQWVWQIRTAHELNLPSQATPWTDLLRQLEPVPTVAKRVLQFSDAHLAGRPYVGVMIRAHQRSHQRTLESSPVEWFLYRMNDAKRRWPNIRFFVSSDVDDVAQYVVSRVPGAYSLTEKGPYNSTLGVQSAVADLYLLAGSGHLIGPHWSSFVEIAHYLSDQMQQLVTPDAEPEEPTLIGPVRNPLRPWLRMP